MTKTFEDVSEGSAMNYLFLKTQITVDVLEEPPVPPPLPLQHVVNPAVMLTDDLEDSAGHQRFRSWHVRNTELNDYGETTMTTDAQQAWLRNRPVSPRGVISPHPPSPGTPRLASTAPY